LSNETIETFDALLVHHKKIWEDIAEWWLYILGCFFNIGKTDHQSSGREKI